MRLIMYKHPPTHPSTQMYACTHTCACLYTSVNISNVFQIMHEQFWITHQLIYLFSFYGMRRRTKIQTGGGQRKLSFITFSYQLQRSKLKRIKGGCPAYRDNPVWQLLCTACHRIGPLVRLMQIVPSKGHVNNKILSCSW